MKITNITHFGAFLVSFPIFLVFLKLSDNMAVSLLFYIMVNLGLLILSSTPREPGQPNKRPGEL